MYTQCYYPRRSRQRRIFFGNYNLHFGNYNFDQTYLIGIRPIAIKRIFPKHILALIKKHNRVHHAISVLDGSRTHNPN